MCKKWVKVGIAAGVVGVVVSVILQMLTSGITGPLFQSSAAVWKSWMAPEMYLIYIVPIWVGLIMALVYTNFDKKSHMYKNGWAFGFKVWLLAGLPGMLMTYSSFAVPDTLVWLWLVTGLIQYLIMGWIIAKMKP